MTSSTQSVKPPMWFWIASVAGLIWNILGVFAYLGQAFMTDEIKAGIPEDQLALMESTPAWVTAAFAIAVWGGMVGCIALLIRKRWAKTVLLISLLGIVLQMSYSFFMTNAAEVYGVFQAVVMPILVIAIGLLLYLMARVAERRLWLK